MLPLLLSSLLGKRKKKKGVFREAIRLLFLEEKGVGEMSSPFFPTPLFVALEKGFFFSLSHSLLLLFQS